MRPCVWWQTSIPGRPRKGDGMYFCAGSQTTSNGDKLTYGQLGEVMGPKPGDPNRVAMKFPGNKGNVNCRLTELSRNPPVRVGWVWWVKSGVKGGV